MTTDANQPCRRRTPMAAAALVALALPLAACEGTPSAAPTGDTSTSAPPGSTTPMTTPPSAPSASPAPTASPATASTVPTPAPPAPVDFDPRNRFFDPDERLRTSPWFAGQGRVMIGFGCTDAPWYDTSSKCSGGAGFHHGIDVALPCGTELRSAVSGTVVGPGRGSGLGSAYGSRAFLIRDQDTDRDLIVGHAQKLLVSPGTRVSPGQPIALAGADEAPDGCHLHLEQRPVGGSVNSAEDPSEVLELSPA